MARPTKATDDRVERILGLLRIGVPKEAAAESAGVGKTTFFEWQRTKPQFREAVEKAVAESEALLVGRIAKAATETKHWTAAAWLLERRVPERYARRDTLEHVGRVGVDVTLDRLREIREKAEARKKAGKD